jgi:hypothetical protein
MTPPKKTASVGGRPLNAYVQAEDITLVRELATFISGRGYRVSDSQVIRAALRVAKADNKFFNAFKEVLATDGRFKKDE